MYNICGKHIFYDFRIQVWAAMFKKKISWLSWYLLGIDNIGVPNHGWQNPIKWGNPVRRNIKSVLSTPNVSKLMICLRQ